MAIAELRFLIDCAIRTLSHVRKTLARLRRRLPTSNVQPERLVIVLCAVLPLSVIEDPTLQVLRSLFAPIWVCDGPPTG
eukprot:2446265-Pyramimonas_sp.AAC.1